MDDNFNPYHRWLGIPPQELPADHYRLLGLAKFEDDLDVIKDASERQIAHVRRKALGKYQDVSQKILNELAGARSILLNASDKKAYDAQLQARLAPAKPAIRIPQAKPIPTPTPPPPFPETKPPTPIEIPFPQLVNNDLPRATSPRKKTPQKALKFQLPKFDLSNKTTQLALAGGGVLVLMILVASWAIFGGSGTPKKTEENQQELTQADSDPPKKVVEEPAVSPQASSTDPAKTAIPDASKAAPKDPTSTAKLSPPPVPNILPLDAKITTNSSPPPKPTVGPEPPPTIAPFDARQARAHQEAWAKHLGTTVETTNSINMRLVLCPPGEFMMGSSDTDKDTRDEEKPQHRVEISKPFYIGMYEISQKEFRAVTGNSPWKGQRNIIEEGDQNAASYISWNDAAEFCQKLSLSDGKTYRLPTEAEWEYACRAGTTTRFSFGDDERNLNEFGWWGSSTNGNAKSYPQIVGTKTPNPYGLYDMHGNVLEWCQDKWSDNYLPSSSNKLTGTSARANYVVRGGHWYGDTSYCRSVYRTYDSPSNRYLLNGFRVVCEVGIGLGTTKTSSTATTETSISSPPPKPTLGSEPPPAIAPFDAPQGRAYQEAWAKYLGTTVESTNSIDMKLVLCPPGEFMMGSPDTDRNARSDEKPQHRVKISKPFYIDMYEVTQKEFLAVTGKSPWQGQPYAQEGNQNAASFISWDDAAEFCQTLSTREGKTYRLPTEAEWEYACRAGTTTRFSFGDDGTKLSEFSWWDGAAGNGNVKTEQYAHVVGTKQPNVYGLFDMHGNVAEWCQDFFEPYSIVTSNDPIGPSAGSIRVIRGGHWNLIASFCRSASRNHYFTPSTRSANFGFRVVRELEIEPATNKASSTSTATPSNSSTPPKPSTGPEPPPAIAPFNASQARAHQDAWAKHLGTTVETTNSVDMKLVLCSPGEFMMGSPDTDKDASPTEKPQHRVNISKPFYIGMYEVTQKEFRTVTGNSPWQGRGNARKGDQNAASHISWNDAVEFCQKLSTREGKTYRLPTEVEWEYACRAGTTTCFSFGDDEMKLSEFDWWGGHFGDGNVKAELYAHIVGTRKPNANGLYDMHGNVSEWCQDKFETYSPIAQIDATGPSAGSNRVIRGGNWYNHSSFCRSAYRNSNSPSFRNSFGGFRVVCELGIGLGTIKTSTTPNAEASSPSPPSKLRAGPEPPLAIAPFDAQRARAHQEAWAKHLGTTVETINSIDMKLVLCPPGEFMMGSPDTDKDATPNEKPQHRVKITRPFYIGMYEVTQKEFRSLTGNSPWQGKEYVHEGDQNAASWISWDDAVEFCRKLSTREGKTYRLPTEAEWECACRAGTTTRFSFGNDEMKLSEFGWWGGLVGEGNAKTELYAHIVGTKKPNAYGLYDMHGNVTEWCEVFLDPYSLSTQIDPTGRSAVASRVLRGGRWSNLASICRGAYRSDQMPSSRLNGSGFRIVRER